MGGPFNGLKLGAFLRSLPRSLLKCFIVHFDPTWGPPSGGGGPLRGPWPSLTFQEGIALARYRCMHWFPSSRVLRGALGTPMGPPGGAPAEGDPKGAPKGAPKGPQGAPLGLKPPAIWPSQLCLPEGPPPPTAAEIPRGLLRVQALGHGTFLLQTRGAPGGLGGPLSILTNPFFSKRAGPWGRIGRKQHQYTQQQQ